MQMFKFIASGLAYNAHFVGWFGILTMVVGIVFVGNAARTAFITSFTFIASFMGGAFVLLVVSTNTTAGISAVISFIASIAAVAEVKFGIMEYRVYGMIYSIFMVFAVMLI